MSRRLFIPCVWPLSESPAAHAGPKQELFLPIIPKAIKEEEKNFLYSTP